MQLLSIDSNLALGITQNFWFFIYMILSYIWKHYPVFLNFFVLQNKQFSFLHNIWYKILSGTANFGKFFIFQCLTSAPPATLDSVWGLTSARYRVNYFNLLFASLLLLIKCKIKLDFFAATLHYWLTLNYSTCHRKAFQVFFKWVTAEYKGM